MVDLGEQPGTFTVKMGRHPARPIRVGRLVNTVMPGEFAEGDLEAFVFALRQASASAVVHAGSAEFPDNFSGALMRGSRMGGVRTYVDDPSTTRRRGV